MSTSVKPSAKKSKNQAKSSTKSTTNSGTKSSTNSGTKSKGRRSGAAKPSGKGRSKTTAKVRGRSASEVSAAQQRAKRPVKVSVADMKDGRIKRSTTVGSTATSGSGLFGDLWARFAGRNNGGGVAPFVPPKHRMSRRLKVRELGKRGFVPLSPGKQKLRHRILPRTVIGIASMLMAAGIGAAFSGAAFYAYYDNRLAENERTVARFVEGFDQQFTDAAAALDEVRTESVGTIRQELDPLEGFVTDARAVINLPGSAGPSVWLVETKDEEGQASHGSAFAVIGHRGGTALVTSYSVVLASTTAPGPGIELVKGDQRIAAELWAWDAERDLALVVVDRQIPLLKLAPENAQLRSIGGRVFALSGFGGQGATASPGYLLDHSQVGLQHTAPLGALYVGGPLLNAEGQVLGMASGSYAPFGIDPGDVGQAPDVRAICAKILRCSELDQDSADDLTIEDEGAIEDEGLIEDGTPVLEVEVGTSG